MLSLGRTEYVDRTLVRRGKRRLSVGFVSNLGLRDAIGREDEERSSAYILCKRVYNMNMNAFQNTFTLNDALRMCMQVLN